MFSQAIVSLMNIDGEEYLFYRSFPVTAAIIRGTSADTSGNVTIEKEALKLEILEIALAAKASGGKVIVQVERAAAEGSLCAKDIAIPGQLVDAVVITEEPETYHRTTAGTAYSPYMTGEVRCPAGDMAQEKAELSAEDIVCRRAVMELFEGAVVNVGVGIGSGVGPAAGIEGMQDKVTFTLELGVFGGIPQPAKDFGVAVNPGAFVAHPSMFDYYHGGNLDMTFLGMAQMDAEGNVNVSKFGGRAAGQGGFIDISQCSKKVVFCSYFSAKGFRSHVEDGKIVIDSQGQIPKFVAEVDQITFNGKLSRAKGQEVVIVTERCVFKLVPEGVMLTEIAPGLDLRTDILDQMGFVPIISDDLKIMDERIFCPGRMGYFDN